MEDNSPARPSRKVLTINLADHDVKLHQRHTKLTDPSESVVESHDSDDDSRKGRESAASPPRPSASSEPAVTAADDSKSVTQDTGSSSKAINEHSKGNSYGAIAFWIFMSCSVIMFNKFLYSTNFRYPLTLTSIHMLFASCSTGLMRLCGLIERPSVSWSIWFRNVLPIGVLYALSLSTSNMGASMLSIPFVQMIKALTPLVTLVAGIGFKVQGGAHQLVAIVAIISVGVIIASFGELNWNTLGFTFQVISILCEGTRLVVTQILLQQHLPKSNPFVSISFFAPPSFLLLAPVALYFEPHALQQLSQQGVGVAVLANTLTAFVLNVAVVVLVSKTSGLVLTLAGIVKDMALIVVSILFFSHIITPLQAAGYLLSLIGMNAYNVFQASKGSEQSVMVIMQTAVTNPQSKLIYVGAFILLILSVVLQST